MLSSDLLTADGKFSLKKGTTTYFSLSLPSIPFTITVPSLGVPLSCIQSRLALYFHLSSAGFIPVSTPISFHGPDHLYTVSLLLLLLLLLLLPLLLLLLLSSVFLLGSHLPNSTVTSTFAMGSPLYVVTLLINLLTLSPSANTKSPSVLTTRLNAPSVSTIEFSSPSSLVYSAFSFSPDAVFINGFAVTLIGSSQLL